MRKNILVTGATGKQGSALVHALLSPPSPPTVSPPDSNPPIINPNLNSSYIPEYHIYALTRTLNSPAAQSLLRAHHPEDITLVQGDLDDLDSITAVFETAQFAGQGIWGVFAVIAFPGLGNSAEGEERQGKMLGDLSLTYGVKVYVYSSALRAGPKWEFTEMMDAKPSGKAKRNIEVHCKELGDKGLNWIILRPGFFMENFDDFIGSVAFAIMKKGLKEDSSLALIASEDIGNVAAAVFRDHERYVHKVLVLTSEYSTMSQIGESYQRATGKAIPAVPSAFAWLLVKMNKATQDLIQDMEQNQNARASGDYPELAGEVALANSAYKMKTFSEWVKLKQNRKEQAEPRNWNEVSLGKLLTGRM